MANESNNTIKANSRGYAYLGKVEGCPDLSTVKTAEFVLDEKTTGKIAVALNKTKDDCGNMLRRGYIHVGKANLKVKVKFSKSGIAVNPA